MENYVKAVLYAYPSLQRMKEAYAQHIRTKAMLSCEGRMDTERLTEYLLEEILQKRRLEWLKDTLEAVLNRLTDLERALIEVAFFNKREKMKLVLKGDLQRTLDMKSWSNRTRFRFLKKAVEKVKALLWAQGLTKERFEKEFLHIEMMRKIYRRLLRAAAKAQHASCYSSIS